MATERRAVPLDIEVEILSLSRRRCCLCFGLLGDFGLKRGQIAHLDHDPSHNDLDDLAYLCLDHHDEYDSTTRQSKGLRLKEVKLYRQALYEAVRQHLPGSTEEIFSQGEGDDPLAARGELDFYLSSFAVARDSGRRSLRSISEATRVATAAMGAANDEALDEIRKGAASKAGRSRYYSKLASALTSFAHTLTRATCDLAPTAKRMLDFLSRASAVASDFELATASRCLRTGSATSIPIAKCFCEPQEAEKESVRTLSRCSEERPSSTVHDGLL